MTPFPVISGFQTGPGHPALPSAPEGSPKCTLPLLLQAFLAEQPQVLSYLSVPLHQYLLTWQEQKSRLYRVDRHFFRHQRWMPTIPQEACGAEVTLRLQTGV